jgi:hypothetical protein
MEPASAIGSPARTTARSDATGPTSSNWTTNEPAASANPAKSNNDAAVTAADTTRRLAVIALEIEAGREPRGRRRWRRGTPRTR